MKQIDILLNRITMYRLVVYGLGITAVAAILLAFAGRLSFNPLLLILSLLLICVSCLLVNFGLSKLLAIPTNSESWLITALILFLIIKPADSIADFLTLILAAIIAIASKFLMTWNGKHIFNPAALAAAVLSLSTLGIIAWWVGSTQLWPITLIIGLLVVRKQRKFPMVLAFVTVSLLIQLLSFILDTLPLGSSMQSALISSPLIFLATIMLTEPATMPPRRKQQIVFGLGVGILYATAWHIGQFYIHPEMALLLGNLYAFMVSPKMRLKLQLKEIQQISERVYSYVFITNKNFSYQPGQYMDFTLAGVPFDSRGNRRTFTIASSPTEKTIQIGMKHYKPSSAFKRTFKGLKPGDLIYGGQIAGNFTLPTQNRKLAFIAGGIGITPFRSMIKHIVDKQIMSDVVLIYVASDPNELAYLDIFKAATDFGVKTTLIANQPDTQKQIQTGRLDTDTIRTLIPDYAERLFYISGPHDMVEASKSHLKHLSIKRSHIRTDHFSGY